MTRTVAAGPTISATPLEQCLFGAVMPAATPTEANIMHPSIDALALTRWYDMRCWARHEHFRRSYSLITAHAALLIAPLSAFNRFEKTCISPLAFMLSVYNALILINLLFSALLEVLA